MKTLFNSIKTKKLVNSILCILTFLSTQLNAQTYQWAHGFTSNFYGDANKIKSDGSGNYYIAGNFSSGPIDFDPSASSFTLTGSTSNANGFVAKYNASGTFSLALMFSATTASGSCFINDIAIDAAQNIYATGYYTGSVDFDPTATTTISTSSGAKNVFIAKLNANGTLAWVQSIGGAGDDVGYSIALDAGGNLLTGGTFNGSNIDFNAGAGTNSLTSTAADGYLLKLNANTGAYVNVIKIGDVGSDNVKHIKTDASNNVYIGGGFSSTAAFSGISYAGGVDAYVAKYNSSLALSWAKGVGSINNEAFGEVELDASGNVYFCGNFSGSSDFDPSVSVLTFTTSSATDYDGYILKLDNTGNLIWARQLGATGNCMPQSVNVDAVGNVYTSGYFFGSIDFDPSSVQAYYTSKGSSDIFIHKLNSTGNYIQTQVIGNAGEEDCRSISVNPTTNAYAITGSLGSGSTSNVTTDFNSTVATNTVNGQFYIAKYNACSYPTLPVNTTAVSSQTICTGSTANLSVASNISTAWYAAPGNTTTIGTGASYTTPTLTSTTNYYVDNSNSCGSTAKVEIVVNVAQNPTVSITPTNPSICIGTTATLTANGATNYTWMPGGITGNSIAVTPSTNTSYSLSGTNNFCPTTGSAVKTVTVKPIPNISATITSSNIAVCAPGSSVTLQASGNSGYTWTPGNTVGTVINVSPASPTTYTVSSILNGCVGTETVYVGTSSNPTVSISSSTPSACSGTTVTLTGNGASTYTWTGGPFSAGTVTPSINLLYNSTTTYSVRGANTDGCSNTTIYTLTINPTPTVSITSSNSTICSGFNSTLTANGAVTYTWQPVSVVGNSVIVSPSTTTTYTVNASSAAGCTNTATKSITVNPTPTIAVNSGSICSGKSFTIIPSGARTYTISGGQSIVSPTSNTSYSVTGTSSLGCLGTNTAIANVVVQTSPTITIAGSNTVCSGNAVNLTANGASTYTWNTGAQTNTIAPSISSNTNYTVAGAIGTCTSNAIKTVSVIANPTLTTSSSVNSICNGTSVSINASGASTYLWMPGSLTNSVVSISPTTTTIYTVTGTAANGCTNTAVRSITVNATPTVNVNSGAICTGGTFTIIPSGTGVSFYSISGGSYVVSPSSNSSYTLTGTSAQGCTNTAVSTVSVQTSLTVSIAGSNSVCIGTPINLTANGAATYTWSTGSTSYTIAPSPTSNTTYTVTGASGTCSSTAVKSITVNPTPTVSAVTSTSLLCTGNSATLTASGANTYNWLPGSVTGSAITINPTSNTTYTVTGTNTFGCIDVSIITQSVSLCTAIENITNNFPSLNFYPNPFNDIITIESELPISKIILCDVLGKEVSTVQKINNEQQTRLSTNEFPEGIYFMTVYIDNQHKTYKIIKK